MFLRCGCEPRAGSVSFTSERLRPDASQGVSTCGDEQSPPAHAIDEANDVKRAGV